MKLNLKSQKSSVGNYDTHLTFLVSIHYTDPQCTVSIAHAEARRVHIYNHNQRCMSDFSDKQCFCSHYTIPQGERVYFWCSGLSWNIFSCLLSLAFSPLAFLVFPFFVFGLLYSSTTALRTKLASMSSSFIWGRQFLRNALVNASAAAPGWDCKKWQWATYWQVCKVFVTQTVRVYLHQLTVPLFKSLQIQGAPIQNPNIKS